MIFHITCLAVCSIQGDNCAQTPSALRAVTRQLYSCFLTPHTGKQPLAGLGGPKVRASQGLPEAPLCKGAALRARPTAAMGRTLLSAPTEGPPCCEETRPQLLPTPHSICPAAPSTRVSRTEVGVVEETCRVASLLSPGAGPRRTRPAAAHSLPLPPPLRAGTHVRNRSRRPRRRGRAPLRRWTRSAWALRRS